MSRGRFTRKPRKKPVYKGITMASKKECQFAETCDNRDIPWEYEPEELPWEPPVKTRKYHPDFRIKCKDGYKFLVEYKGYLRQDEKVKMKCIRQQYPDLDIRFVFQNANAPVAGAKQRKDGTKQTHAEWAEKYGFLWAEGFLPREWLTGRRFINRINKQKARAVGAKKTRRKYANKPKGLQ